MHCYSSSHPASVNATQLYDFKNDEGNFWKRSNLDVHLPPCSSSSPPPDSQCLACIDEIVYAVCQNLTDAVEMIMEAGATKVEISTSECPKLSSGEYDTTMMSILLPIFLPILLLLLMLAVFIYWKRCRNPNAMRGGEDEMPEEVELSIHTEKPVQDNGIP